jgi:PAS domain S-box-containing protein
MKRLISENFNILHAYLYSLEELLIDTDYYSAISKSLLKLAEAEEADHAALYCADIKNMQNQLYLRSEYSLAGEGIISTDSKGIASTLELSDEYISVLGERRAFHLVVNENSGTDSVANMLSEYGLFDSIIIPLFRKNGLWGLMLLSRKKSGFLVGDDQLTMLARLGGLISNALDHHYDREHKDKLALIARKNRLGVQIADRFMNITYVNDSLKKISGYSKPEMIGRNLLDLMKGPLTQAKGVELLTNGHQGAYPVDIDLILYRKDKSWFWANVKQQPINGEGGGDNQHFAFIQDISEKKNAEEYVRNSGRRLSALIQNLKEGILLGDQDHRITIVNQSFCDLFNLPGGADELSGKDTSTVLNDISRMFTTPERFIEFYSETISAGKISTGNEWKHINGQVYESDYIPIMKNDNIKGHLWKFTDITLRKKAEESSRAKETFLATISHEIRTPLNVIMGMIREISRESLSPKQELFIKNAEVSSRHLLSIVNNVLDITKIESGQLDLDMRTFNIREVINEAISIIDTSAGEKMLSIFSTVSDDVRKEYVGDSGRIRQILLNVLDNAVKFTDEGSIYISCTSYISETGNSLLKVNITDTGTGIEEEVLKNIFSRFTNTVDNKGKNKGAGIGLSVSYELAKLMDGDLTVSSMPGKGTTVELILPLHQSEPAEGSKTEELPSADILRGKKILLAEDSFLNRLVAVNALSFHGIQVTEAVDGKDALEKLKGSHFDLILMDLQMPEMGGLEATGIIRKDMGLKIPIIALTANAFRSELERCLETGMNDYIIKPFEESRLVSVILRHISSTEANDKQRPGGTDEDAAKLYDLKLIHGMSRGNTGFVKQMITVFCDQIPEMVHEMKEFSLSGEYEKMSRLAHKVKPNLANFGIVSLEKEIKAIEMYNISETDQITLNDLISKVETITAMVRICLLEELKNML